MSDPIGAAGGASVQRISEYDLQSFDALQRRLAPQTPPDAGVGPRQGLATALADELKATSDAYRAALREALDPLAPGVFPPEETAGAGGGSAPVGVEQPLDAGESLGGRGEVIGPRGGAAGTGPQHSGGQSEQGAGTGSEGAAGAALSQTDQALSDSVALMMRAHSELMRRQIGVTTATSTLEAATSGARSSGQNIDTLLRGQ